MDNGTDDIKCSYSSSSYRYEPCGHIVTGDLSIIRDITLTLYNRLCLKLLCRFVPLSVTFGTLLERFVYLC